MILGIFNIIAAIVTLTYTMTADITMKSPVFSSINKTRGIRVLCILIMGILAFFNCSMLEVSSSTPKKTSGITIQQMRHLRENISKNK